jgi:hypothetical protein
LANNREARRFAKGLDVCKLKYHSLRLATPTTFGLSSGEPTELHEQHAFEDVLHVTSKGLHDLHTLGLDLHEFSSERYVTRHTRSDANLKNELVARIYA